MKARKVPVMLKAFFISRRVRNLRLALAIVVVMTVFHLFGNGILQNLVSVAFASPLPKQYVGVEVCSTCHAKQVNDWTGSDHSLAMQVASSSSVLGNFENSSFRYASVKSRFWKRDGRFFVRTDGADGKLADFEIKYTFGVRPLQQYLIELPGGRLQALGIAWDSRTKDSGGQRWFHLYPGQNVTAGDALHWTGINQNWNFMCSECHSTQVRKNFDPVSGSFNTSWAEPSVSCEACHGPGSDHVAWSGASKSEQLADKSKGLVIALSERNEVSWSTPSIDQMPQRIPPAAIQPHASLEITVCARCHARANRVSDDYVHGQSPLNTHRPVLLTEGLYWVDGQQRDEVFTWGSFVQSKMHAKGVICSDCHQPHSGKLRVLGNQLCSQCHLASKYDNFQHSHHARGTAGAACVACHMPTTTYMVIDPRHDHSLRVPRPDLSMKYGVPNACTTCHTKQSTQWAVGALKEWNDHLPTGFQRFTDAFYEDNVGAPSAGIALQALVADASQPALVRASAIERLGRRASAKVLDSILSGLHDSDALIRVVSVEALASGGSELRRRYLTPMLIDAERVVRATTANALAGDAEATFSVQEQKDFEKALSEYIAMQSYNADRPESQINLGNLYAARDQVNEAIQHYEMAIKIAPEFNGAYLNLAELHRMRGFDQEAETVLRRGLPRVSQPAALQHSLGLVLIRQNKMIEALKSLADAVHGDAGNSRYAYVYGVALHDSGSITKGDDVLERALVQHPNDPNLLNTLAQYAVQARRLDKANAYTKRLKAIQSWR